MRKQLIVLILPLLLVALVLPTSDYASAESREKQITVFIDREQQYFEQNPIIEEGRTLVPMRHLFELLGATIQWDSSTNTITATKGHKKVLLTINSQTAFIDNQAIRLDVLPKIVNGRILVPLRFVAQALGAKISWEANAQIIFISTASSEDEQILNTLFQSEISTLYILHEQMTADIFEGKKLPFSSIKTKLQPYYTNSLIENWEAFYHSSYFSEWYTHTDYLFDFLLNEPYLSETTQYKIEKIANDKIVFSFRDDPRLNEGPMCVMISNHTYVLLNEGNGWLIDQLY